MTAPPKPWELARSSTSLAPSTGAVVSQATPLTNTTPTDSSGLNSTPYRRPMNYSMRPGMGMSGMGMSGMGYGGMGMGMGMSGMGYGGMGMGYGGMGMGYGQYGSNSRGLMAIERFSMMVNSLCFTAETIEHSMNSMKVFWDTLLRIKAWGAGGLLALQKMLHNKIQYFWQYFLYLIGKGEKPQNKDKLSLKKLVLNLAILYLIWLAFMFCWTEFTKPGEMPAEDFESF